MKVNERGLVWVFLIINQAQTNKNFMSGGGMTGKRIFALCIIFFGFGVLTSIGYQHFVQKVTAPSGFDVDLLSKTTLPSTDQMQAYSSCCRSFEDLTASSYLQCKDAAISRWFFVKLSLARCDLVRAKVVSKSCEGIVKNGAIK